MYEQGLGVQRNVARAARSYNQVLSMDSSISLQILVWLSKARMKWSSLFPSAKGNRFVLNDNHSSNAAAGSSMFEIFQDTSTAIGQIQGKVGLAFSYIFPSIFQEDLFAQGNQKRLKPLSTIVNEWGWESISIIVLLILLICLFGYRCINRLVVCCTKQEGSHSNDGDGSHHQNSNHNIGHEDINEMETVD
mmetsp:Transcript_38488/g.50733  ORF Transcript_38488/g.50733 Transcript_38488/m.50733 type:complete len:191 (-) Transcript_38488:14-586(-)